MKENLSVIKQIENEFVLIREKVIDAYENATFESEEEIYIPFLGKTNNEWVNLEKPIYIPSEVYVENSHLYPFLLKQAYEIVIEKAGGNVRDLSYTIQYCIDNDLQHEYEHHTPLLEIDTLKIWYGVKFIKHKENNIIGILPCINYFGKCSVKVCIDSTSAPKDLSDTDKYKLKTIAMSKNNPNLSG
ncbi:hypothetical protein ACFL15_00480 [Patescibacteria group bacterium]